MTPLTHVSSLAAVLREDYVDTDVIFPARFLLLMDREGLGQYLFRDRRYDGNTLRSPPFILDRPPFDAAQILITGTGFGCGSSREQAPWALHDHGIRVLIASGFGDIFRNNCVKTGILPIEMAPEVVSRLMTFAEEGVRFFVNLETRELKTGEFCLPISAPQSEIDALLKGQDETTEILERFGENIEVFENAHRAAQPWLFRNTD